MQILSNYYYTEWSALTRDGPSNFVKSVLTQVLRLQCRRSVDLTIVAATLSWALLVDALGWNFLVDKPPQHDKVSFIERWGGRGGGDVLKNIFLSKIALKTFLLLILTLLPNCCEISRPYLVPVPNYWTWLPLKKINFSGQIPIKSKL